MFKSSLKTEIILSIINPAMTVQLFYDRKRTVKTDTENSYRFPLPDNEKFIEEINSFISWHNQKYNDNVISIQELVALNQIIIGTNVQTPLLAIDFIEETTIDFSKNKKLILSLKKYMLM